MVEAIPPMSYVGMMSMVSPHLFRDLSPSKPLGRASKVIQEGERVLNELGNPTNSLGFKKLAIIFDNLEIGAIRNFRNHRYYFSVDADRAYDTGVVMFEKALGEKSEKLLRQAIGNMTKAYRISLDMLDGKIFSGNNLRYKFIDISA